MKARKRGEKNGRAGWRYRRWIEGKKGWGRGYKMKEEDMVMEMEEGWEEQPRVEGWKGVWRWKRGERG
jgi:hypothetical protein